MSRSRAIVIVLVLASVTPPLMLAQWLLLKVSPRLSARFPHIFHRNVCRVLQARIHVVGDPVTDGPCLLAANHSSWLDVPVLTAVRPVSFIAKREVGAWPFFGSLARLQRSVFVDRDRRASTGTSRDVMQSRLSGGDTLVLFPEGTSSDGNRVLPFKSALMGAADMKTASIGNADGGAVLVQPVTIAYTRLHGLPMTRRERPFFAWYGDMDMLPHIWSALMRGPFDVEVRFHPPVTVTEIGNRKQLASHCETVVRQGLIEAISGVDARPVKASS
jgi:1-acyl-sn-glycerol-3-phosphate acyltransferase